jgi:hypothetical protein
LKTTRSARPDIHLDEVSVPSFGYELLREEVLSNILGKDSPEILYWSGKQLARSYPLPSLSDIALFFEKAGWGNLIMKKEQRNELLFELTSPLISHRIQKQKDSHYKLEAGFIAQQIETQTGMITEAYEQVQKKAESVEIIVRWDYKDHI